MVEDDLETIADEIDFLVDKINELLEKEETKSNFNIKQIEEKLFVAKNLLRRAEDSVRFLL